MTIAKFLAGFVAGAAMIAAPFTVVSAQSVAHPDSSSHKSGKWVAGTGAVSGAALFMAFAQGNGANHNSFTPPHQTNAGDNTPPSNTTPPANVTPPSNVVTNDSTPSDTTTVLTQTPQGQDSPPASTGEPAGPTTDDSGPIDTTGDNPFIQTDGGQPHEDAPPSQFENPSTVPEPGSLALTATGIIGLIPLIRRRRR